MKGLSKIWAIILAVVVIVAVLGGISYIMFLGPSAPAPPSPQITTPTTPATSPQVTLPPTPAMGPPVQKIVIITTTEAEDPQRWAAVQAIASEWRKLGFEVEVIGLEASQVDKKCYYEWDFDVCVFGWGARIDRLDPNLFLG